MTRTVAASDGRTAALLLALLARPLEPERCRAELTRLESVLPGGRSAAVELMDLADQHDVEAVVAAALAGLDPDASDPLTELARRVRAARTDRTEELALRMLRLHHLGELLPALTAVGAEPLVLKGPALAHDLTGDPLDRPFGDLDLLVPAEAIPEARAALAGIGYRRVAGDVLARPPRLSGREPDYHETHLSSDGGVAVELHRALHPPFLGPSPSYHELRADARRIPLRGTGASLLALGAEAQLSVLAAHAGKHRWVRLKWVVDIARLIDRSGGAPPLPIDPAYSAALARRWGWEHDLAVAIGLARDLLRAHPEPALVQAAVPDRVAAQLTLRFAERLRSGEAERAERLWTAFRLYRALRPQEWLGLDLWLLRRLLFGPDTTHGPRRAHLGTLFEAQRIPHPREE